MNDKKNCFHKSKKEIIFNKIKKRCPKIFKSNAGWLKEIKKFPIKRWNNDDLELIDCIKNFMTKDCFNKSLFHSYLNQNTGTYKNELLLRLFPKIDKKMIMWWKDDYKTYKRLPKEIIIYRGCSKKDVKRPSWSIDKKHAKTLGSNLGKPFLYQAKILKKDVYFYTNHSDEMEIIVNPDKITSEKKIGCIRKRKENSWFKKSI